MKRNWGLSNDISNKYLACYGY